MTRQILFIQGGGADVHDAWDHKLVTSLESELGPDAEIRYPRMPNEDDPKYTEWKPAIGGEIAKLNDGAILIGHSIGGAMLIHALAEQLPKQRLGAIILISAPFVGQGGWPSDDIEPKPELGVRLPAGIPVHLFHGMKDETAPSKHAELYAKAIPQAQIHRLADRDHQLNNDLREVAEVVRGISALSP
jgi:pimeloyl-ACP methyl ester carboxylesterase